MTPVIMNSATQGLEAGRQGDGKRIKLTGRIIFTI